MEKRKTSLKTRDAEKGAALVMALVMSFLVLVACAGLLLEVTTNSANVTDAAAEKQAYYAAESGIQAAIYVLRDNVRLPDNKLIDPTKPASDPANRIDYLKALNIADSNLAAGSERLDSVPRLSRWLNYNPDWSDRVTMDDGPYDLHTGYAFNIEISDPDNTGTQVTYSTLGRFSNPDATSSSRRTYGDTTNGFVIEYIPQTSIQVDTRTGLGMANFGTFRVTKYGGGALVGSYNRFEIVVSMTLPYSETRILRGYLTANTCLNGVCTMPNVLFDSRTFTLQGSKITLLSVGGNSVATTLTQGPPPGFNASLSTSASSVIDNVISGTISPPEPIRLRIRSTGFGPKRAIKQLEAIIQKNFFNGVTGPATLTLVGPSSTTACAACVPAQPATTATFNPGSSNVADYSGQDEASSDIIPPIGTTSAGNLDTVSDSVDGLPPHPFNGNVIGVPSDVSTEISPSHWLYSPSTVDSAVKSFYSVAKDSGRYFPIGVQPSTFGDNATGTGLTFCDGDCVLSGNGGGIMIVTGTLTLDGNFSFRGMIIVTGQGGVKRKGAGNGTIAGNLIIAPYVNSGVLPSSEPVWTSFLAPQYDLSGGGSSTIAYNSSAVGSGLGAVDNFVLGVVEK